MEMIPRPQKLRHNTRLPARVRPLQVFFSAAHYRGKLGPIHKIASLQNSLRGAGPIKTLILSMKRFFGLFIFGKDEKIKASREDQRKNIPRGAV